MWLKQISKDSDVVVSTRLRFARNIKGYKFPHMLEVDELTQIVEKVGNVVDKSKYKLLKLKDMDKITIGSLVEQHLISKEYVENTNGAIITNKDNTIVVMMNEEDHLRIQSFESGFNIDNCYEKLINFTSSVNKKIEFSVSDDYGYLTSCPTNVGSAMRVSVMLHLPALHKVGLLSKLFEQVNSIGLTVRGYYGENSGSGGNMYQISNQKTLGITNEEIISNIKLVISSIVEQERKARQILNKTSVYLEDNIYRAYGTLKNARIIADEEAVKLLSRVRLGVAMGILKETTLEKIQSLMVDTRTNTMKLIFKQDLSKEEENIKRGEYIRREI